MESNLVFQTLNIVDSTNNYAMAQIHAGLAIHGMAFFANGQTAGKGQRFKNWHSQPGENILMSLIIVPPVAFARLPFLFNACVSLACKQFLENTIKEKVNIKWPNDLIIRDRKAGGILIENSFRGKSWNWAVIGIGINVNQIGFPEMQRTPISLKQITEKTYNPELLARHLRKHIVDYLDSLKDLNTEEIMKSYNESLYLSGKLVRMKQNEELFDTSIIKVSDEGQLITQDEVERKWNFGEVEWVAPSIPQ
jgi:BirA family biotin operon repressor/biotin-[acetyl-CoA-carboxylase] ligase